MKKKYRVTKRKYRIGDETVACTKEKIIKVSNNKFDLLDEMAWEFFSDAMSLLGVEKEGENTDFSIAKPIVDCVLDPMINSGMVFQNENGDLIKKERAV